MGLTRPRFSQFDTTISSISDPITVLNKSSTLANIDIGFIMNRNGGALSNVALFWQESTGTFAVAFTSNTGEVTGSISNSNIAVTTYANITARTFIGNISGNIVGGGAILGDFTIAGNLDVNGIGYVKVPVGTTTQRPTATTGQIRYNTTLSSFEGYGGTAWASLGGVKSVDGLTYIQAETSAGASNDELEFYAATDAANTVKVGGWNSTRLLVNLSTDSTNTTSGALQVLGGAGIVGKIYAGSSLTVLGNVTINNTAVTTNTTTGALIVAGGVGIAGTISVGGTLLAGNVSGTAGQVLTSTGAGLTWSAPGGGSANQPFSLTSNDFGNDLSGYTISEDEGDLTAGSTTYDLQYIATLGPITASLLELPSYTTAALPTGQNGGALAYDSSVQTVKFNNGTAWANVAPTYYQIDDLGLAFDGITTTFALTYNNGASISPTNPNQLKIRIGGVDISPFRYSDDLVNLTEIARFDRGFRIVSGNITFVSPPSPGMEFYGTVQANEEAEPQFVFKQTPFSAINIQYGY
jgi:hypothetical protein